MIDETKTFKKFGYISNQLKLRARKKVYRICDKCKKEDIIGFGDYNRLKNSDLCRSCSRKQTLQLPIPKFVPESERFIKGTGIDRILTIKEFNYDPIDLSKKSSRKVICICQKCSKVREVTFYNYRHLCKSCSISKSSKGKKFSNNHIINMIKNHPHLLGENSPNWKGGISKLDQPHLIPINQCIQLNKRFKNSEGHHIMSSIVIFIPKDIHKSIYHNMKSRQGIKEINKLAIDYLMGSDNYWFN